MKFKRTQEYENKLFMQALDEKNVIKDAEIRIVDWGSNHPKAYCEKTDTFLQFPRDLRDVGDVYIADVIEVQNKSVTTKYYRVMKGSIRRKGSDEVVA